MMRLTRLPIKRLDRHRHREIRLAGACRADAEHEIVALDGFEIAALRDGLRRQNLLAEAALLAALEKRAKRNFGIGGHNTQQAVEIAVLEDHSFAHEGEIILQNPFRAGNGFGLALDFQRIRTQSGANVQARFEQAHIFVTRAKKAFDTAADLDCGFHLVGVVPPVNINRIRAANIRSYGFEQRNSSSAGSDDAAGARGRKKPSKPSIPSKFSPDIPNKSDCHGICIYASTSEP